MPSDLYTIVLRHFRLRLPQVNIRSWLAPAEPGVASVPLQKTAQFFDHVIVDQVKYIASRQLQNRADPVICVRNPVSQELWVGELLDIFAVDQPAIGTHHFGRVRWMRPKEIDVSEGVWQSRYVTYVHCSRCSLTLSSSAAMGVRFWVLDSFLDPGELGPSPLIDLNTIVAHAVRLQAYVGNELVWATLRINRVSSLAVRPLHVSHKGVRLDRRMINIILTEDSPEVKLVLYSTNIHSSCTEPLASNRPARHQQTPPYRHRTGARS